MKIVFVTDVEISPLLGGTERISQTLSREFMRRGIPCYSLYLEPTNLDIPKSEFDGKKKIDLTHIKSDLTVFFKTNGISHVIVNLVKQKNKNTICEPLYSVAHSMGVKVVSCYHAMPGEDFIGNKMHNVLFKIGNFYDVKGSIKDLVLNITPKFFWKRRARKKYRIMPENCDKFILLSSSFYDSYCRFAQLDYANNFDYMPNALSFSDFLPVEKLSQKKKEVLIVSRLDERSKLLSTALKVWHEIEKEAELSEWILTIVGGGKDAPYYNYLCRKLKLSRCHLVGRQPEILPYYERAAIFMMTSAYEGFGITLTEAQQMGVVPIAFNSYASLQDIITDKENGVIVPNNDIGLYVQELTKLMKNKEYRDRLAKNGLDSCKKFSQDIIVEKWIELLRQI